MLISVIIPVFNVEQYLDECVQSVFRQTYTNLEIVLVDDGSPDNSGRMCDNYAIIDKRVKVIHKQNGGLSDARNTGLKEATGEYVLFLDSDDSWCDDQLIEKLACELNENRQVDMIIFRMKSYFKRNGKEIESSVFNIEKLKNEPSNEIFRHLLFANQLSMSACFRIVKREVLVKNNIFFVKGLLSEDIDWSLQLWQVLETVSAINTVGYCYRQRAESITTSYGIKNVRDFVFILDKWYKDIENGRIKDQDLSLLYLEYLAYLYPTLLRNYFLISKKERKEEYELLKSIRHLLLLGITPKTFQARRVYDIFGFRITCFLFGLYGLLSKRGIIGIKNLFL